MAHTPWLVCLVSTVSGCWKYGLGRGSACSGHITWPIYFSLDIYAPGQWKLLWHPCDVFSFNKFPFVILLFWLSQKWFNSPLGPGLKNILGSQSIIYCVVRLMEWKSTFFVFSLIIEGTTEMVLQFVMPHKSFYYQSLGFIEKSIFEHYREVQTIKNLSEAIFQ